MKELLELLIGEVTLFGVHFPVIWLVIGGLFLIAIFRKSLWPAVGGGLLLFAYFFI